ncbi:MAG: MFS transporter [Rhodococcus sp.]|uniref:MDR family MFS transporter n=1 Tax=Rhodococcus TaxID=1827 RepID=UPI0016A11CA5|nr:MULTISPECIES: MDR family MFS transporter [Rhodococcus]NLV78944.1 MFS transporter [Rhodococcus sp. (in: high G+C Gram-positive bacteria)]
MTAHVQKPSDVTGTDITPESADTTQPPRVTLIFVALMLAMLAASLSQTVLNPALPTIVGELNGVDMMLWVITAYILASTIMMPIYGKLSDLFGRKPLLITAISVFVAGSVVSATAGSITWLIVGRAIQGLGGGGLMILSQATIADVIPARQRGKYMGVMTSVFALSSVSGPLLGGWFTEGPGWRWAFWINLPIGGLALLGAVFFLRLPRRHGARPPIDVAGMAVLSAATTLLVLVGTLGGLHYGWTSPTILGMIAATVVAVVLFVWIERHAAEPVLPLHLFRDRNFDLCTLAGLLISIALFGVAAYMPTYLQMVAGKSATAAGLLMLPMMGSLFVTSTLSGRWVTRTGRYKMLPIVGSILVAIGMTLLSSLTVDTPIWVLGCYLAVHGIGLGLSMQLLVLVVQNSFPIDEVGTATAGNNYFRQIGATLGSGVVGSVFTARLAMLVTERVPSDAIPGSSPNSLTPDAVHALDDAARIPLLESYNDALTPIYLVIAPLAVVAAIALCFVVEKPLATTLDDKAVPEP